MSGEIPWGVRGISALFGCWAERRRPPRGEVDSQEAAPPVGGYRPLGSLYLFRFLIVRSRVL